MSLHIGAPEAFQKSREFFRASNYSEDFLLTHFKVPALHHFLNPVGAVREYLDKRYQGEEANLVLARLFMGGYEVSLAELERVAPPDVVDAFFELGLIEPASTGKVLSHGILYPIGDLYIASDMSGRYSETGYKGKDFCMTGIEEICRDFLDSCPRTPAKRLLDMGTGCGLAAAVGSLTAEEVIGVDITERAVLYGDFNKHLNQLHNLKFLQGDLFAPVEGLTFDRIVCNPPFEPPLKHGMIYSVGGEDGEAIIARLIEECPKYMEPGGRMFVTLAATDREGETLEQRIVRWLGPHADEFDVALYPHAEFKPDEYAREQVLGTNLDSWKIVEFQMFYARFKAYQVAVGQLIIERHKTKRKPIRIRRKQGPRTTVADLEWILDWEQRSQGPDIEEFVMNSKPSFGEGWELRVRHAPRDNRMLPIQYAFFSEHPSDVEMTIVPWMAMVVAQSFGADTGAELYEALQAKFPVPKQDFVRAVCALVSIGVLRLPGVQASERTPPPAVRKGY